MQTVHMRALVVALAVALVAPSTAAATAPARAALPVQCPQISGPVDHQSGKASSRYVLGAHGGVTCAFARRWVTRILHESTPTSTIARPRGPAGWDCIANAKHEIAFNGACRSGSKSFSWGAS